MGKRSGHGADRCGLRCLRQLRLCFNPGLERHFALRIVDHADDDAIESSRVLRKVDAYQHKLFFAAIGSQPDVSFEDSFPVHDRLKHIDQCLARRTLMAEDREPSNSLAASLAATTLIRPRQSSRKRGLLPA